MYTNYDECRETLFIFIISFCQTLHNKHDLRKNVNLRKLTVNYGVIYEIFNLPKIHIPSGRDNFVSFRTLDQSTLCPKKCHYFVLP